MANNNFKSVSYKYLLIFILGFVAAWLLKSLYSTSESAQIIPIAHDDMLASVSNDDLSWQALQKSNQELNEQVIQLKNQLAKLNALKGATQENSNTTHLQQKSHKRPANMRFLSVDFMKKNLPPVEYIVPEKLRKALDLTEEQSQALALLLRNKMLTDLDIMAPILEALAQGSVEQLFNYGEYGQIDNEQLTQQVEAELQSQQSYFESTLTSVLTEEQINDYYEYEVAQATQQHNLAMNRQAQMIQRIPALEPYQKDEIQRFFDEQPADLSHITIAGARNPLNRRSTPLNADFKAQLQKHLEGILTPEQLAYYQENIALNF